MTGRIYAIGDIHGQLEGLEAAHEAIAADVAREGGPVSTVVHIGDLCDRGPDTRGEDWIVLKGNHDRMFAGWISARDHRDPMLREGLDWLSPNIGGMQTLASYGVERRLIETKAAKSGKAMPKKKAAKKAAKKKAAKKRSVKKTAK